MYSLDSSELPLLNVVKLLRQSSPQLNEAMAILSDLLAKILTPKSRVKKAWKAPKKGRGGPRDKQSELSRGIS